MGKTVKQRTPSRDSPMASQEVRVLRFTQVHDIEVDSKSLAGSKNAMTYLWVSQELKIASKEFSEFMAMSAPEYADSVVKALFTSKRTGEIKELHVPCVACYTLKDQRRYARDSVRLMASYMRLDKKAARE